MKLLYDPMIRERISSLVAKNEKNDKLSIFLQTSRIWQENERAKISLKNLLQSAEKNDANENAVNKVKNLMDEAAIDKDFWRTTQEGLAIFSSEEDFEYFMVPQEFDDTFYTGTHFNVKPLVPFIQMDMQYYVLAFSKKTIRAYKGHNRSIDSLDTSNIPQNIEEMLWMDDPEKSIQHRTSEAHGPSLRGGNAYHGHGDFSTEKKANLRRYINYLDDYIMEIFLNKDLPLILVTDRPNHDIFKELTKYPKVYAHFVDTNPDLMNKSAMEDEVWNLVLESHEKEKRKYWERFENSLGSHLASADIPFIISASFQQRIDTLFVDSSVEIWGKFDVESNSIETSEAGSNGYYDLLNFAIINTLINNGRVFGINAFENENRSPLAAILRF